MVRHCLPWAGKLRALLDHLSGSMETYRDPIDWHRRIRAAGGGSPPVCEAATSTLRFAY